jgi:hypothetical protein
LDALSDCRLGGNTLSFASSLESQPKVSGACQQDEAENHVAGGDLNEIRCKVNGRLAARKFRKRKDGSRTTGSDNAAMRRVI